MKSFRSTAVLALVIAGLIGFVVYDQKVTEKKSAADIEKTRFVPLKVESISKLKLTRPQGVVEIEREKEGWVMLQPVRDPMELEVVDSYLALIAKERGTELQMATPAQWSEYSLDQPALDLEITQSDGVLKIAVSSNAAFDGSHYIRVNDRLYLGAASWAGIVAKGASELRDKRLWRHPLAVSKLQVKLSSADQKDFFTLSQINGKWTQDKSSHLIDSKKVEGYLDGLKNIRGLIVAAHVADAAAMKGLKLEGPATMILQLDGFKAEIWTQKDDKIYARTNESQALLQLTASDRDQVLVTSQELRDGRAPLKMDVARVQKLKVTTSGRDLVFAKNGDGWGLESSKNLEKPNEPALQKVFERIGNMEAKSFYPASQKIGAIRYVLDFRDPEGKTLLRMEIGDTHVPRSGQLANQNLTYARVSGSTEILAVASTDLPDLNVQQLVVPDSPAPDQGDKK